MSLLDFAIIGAQKSGTTALATFLGQHPGLLMSDPKEVHLFDAEQYLRGSPTAAIDEVYSRVFAEGEPGKLRGEATPIYLYWPDTAAELYRYNPDMKLIVLLRDPVKRAFSHYCMEVARHTEKKSFLSALALERRRIGEDDDYREESSAFRVRSYRSRGLYSRQLAAYYEHFPASQILVLNSEDLLRQHQLTLAKVLRFLGVDHTLNIPQQIIFSAQTDIRAAPVASFLLRISYLLEYWRLSRFVDFSILPWIRK